MVVISLVGAISGESLKLLPRDVMLMLKCTKFDIAWSSAPDRAGGAYSAPPDPIAGFKGLLLRGRRGKEGKGGKGDRPRGREGKG